MAFQPPFNLRTRCSHTPVPSLPFAAMSDNVKPSPLTNKLVLALLATKTLLYAGSLALELVIAGEVSQLELFSSIGEFLCNEDVNHDSDTN